MKISYHKEYYEFNGANNNLEISTALGVLSHVSENIMSNIESEDDKSKKIPQRDLFLFRKDVFLATTDRLYSIVNYHKHIMFMSYCSAFNIECQDNNLPLK